MSPPPTAAVRLTEAEILSRENPDMKARRTAVVIPSAGSGLRTGLKTPKALIPLAGSTLFDQTVEVFLRHRRVGLIQPVVPSRKLAAFRSRLADAIAEGSCLPPVAGGRERQDSVYLGIKALPGEVEMIIIHDAARPFVPSSLITRVLNAAERHGAAIAAVAVQDTVKEGTPLNLIAGTVDRRNLWLAQTPQAFQAGIIREAHVRARSRNFRGTDDASLVEALGCPVTIVPGSPLNLKITTPDDIVLARALAREH